MSKTNRIVLLIIVVVVIIFLVMVVSNKKISTTSGTSESLRVSSILSLTGPAAFFGEETKNGMELANTNKQIDIAYEDSASTPAQGISAFSKILIGNNKDLVIVSLSSVASAVMPQAVAAKIPVLQTLVSASDIASKSPYTFRYFTSGGQEAPIAADIAIKNLGAKKIAMLYSNDEYGIAYFDAFKSRVEESGLSLVGSETFTNKDTDYRTQLTKIAFTKPDIIYIIALDKSLVAIIKQVREMNIKTTLMTNWILSNSSVIGSAGSLVEGVYFTTPSFNFESPDLVVTQFRSDYKNVYGKEPSAYAAIAYDIVNILGRIKKSSGDSGLDTVQKIKELGSLKGVMGDLTIDANKEITFKLYPAKIENGKTVTFELK